MNKKMVLLAPAILAVSAGLAFALTVPGGGVAGSIHDMNHYTGATPDQQDRVCAFCHTPHHALTEGNDYLPLWSHALPSSSYSSYDSATVDATIDPGTMMEGPSKLCMSCHDGTVAVDTHYASTGAKKLDSDIFGGAAIAMVDSLSNDHPIGFVYEDVAVGPAENDPADGIPSGGGQDNWIRNKEARYLDNISLQIKDRLYSGSQGAIMTCATCHDVHNKRNVDDPTKTNYLLLSPNNGSKLCLTCHIK